MSPQRRDISTWTLFAILFLTALAFIHAYPVFESNKLTFKDGSFKVVSFSDMHYGETNGDGTWAPWGPEQDRGTTRVHSAILDNEQPDYVVFNGDLVTGENLFAHNATAYLDMCYKPTVDRGIPFSSVLGNHDNSRNINHDQIIQHERRHYPLSRTRSDAGKKPYGNGNYWVPVYDKATDEAPTLILWFLDSRASVGIDDLDLYELKARWVDEAVAKYIEREADRMEKLWGRVPRGLVFVHIPFHVTDLLSYLNAPGSHDDDPGMDGQGWFFPEQTYLGKDMPVFKALHKLPILAITSGHDHGSSWCARGEESSGMLMCMNGHGGYGGYSTPNTRNRNGRAFLITSEGASTWNTYEDGSIGEHLEI